MVETMERGIIPDCLRELVALESTKKLVIEERDSSSIVSFWLLWGVMGCLGGSVTLEYWNFNLTPLYFERNVIMTAI